MLGPAEANSYAISIVCDVPPPFRHNHSTFVSTNYCLQSVFVVHRVKIEFAFVHKPGQSEENISDVFTSISNVNYMELL